MAADGGSLAGEVAIVTGSTLGIGRGVAGHLAEEGAAVVVNGPDQDDADRVAAEIAEAGAATLAVAADVGTPHGADELIARAVEAFGRVDVLVNNAGHPDNQAHILELGLDHWETVLRTNLTGVYLCTHRAARHMVDRGVRGRIVSMSSFAAARAHRNMAAYDATKGGIEAFTRAVALDLAPFGIRVNAVGPGAIRTERLGPHDAEGEARRSAPVPLGRVGEPADVAAAVRFLASEEADYITGQVLYVDGGMLAQLRPPQVDAGLPPQVAELLPGRDR